MRTSTRLPGSPHIQIVFDTIHPDPAVSYSVTIEDHRDAFRDGGQVTLTDTEFDMLLRTGRYLRARSRP